jgi:hypothetical protein
MAIKIPSSERGKSPNTKLCMPSSCKVKDER